MKKSVVLLMFLFLSHIVGAQVPKNVIVEHFTNTKCGVCAFRNPGFYANYKAQSGVLHLAIHPSAPYSGCVLSQHNAPENDARTNYYGIYGGTPRLVIQGVVIPSSADYNSSAIFTPYTGQTSPARINIRQTKYGNDSIRVSIVVKTEAAHTLPNLSLFVALAEDTIQYTGSNGEPVHYDVFRKSLTGASGISVQLPAVVGDSVVFSMSSPVNGDWDFSRIFSLAILQETVSKSVVQVQFIPANSTSVSTGIAQLQNTLPQIRVFDAGSGIVAKQDVFLAGNSITVYDLMGRKLAYQELETSSEIIDLGNTPAGIYLYVIKREGSITQTGKLFIQ